MKRIWDYIEDIGCFTPTAVAVILGALFMLTSCSTKREIQYVDREVVKYETKIQHDTFINISHDSIFYSIVQKGDTVYSTKFVERTKWKDRYVYSHDTIYRDSIQVQNKEVVKEVTKIPQIYHIAMWFFILLVVYFVYKLIRWIQLQKALW